MDALKVNTPEELHQAIGEFLQSDYSRENLVKMYDDTRKCATSFRGIYSALPVLSARKSDPLDGLQYIMDWSKEASKVVDDIASNLEQQIISEVTSQLKKLRGFADSVLSLVDTKLKEQAQKEARAKVEKEYKNLNEEASKTKGMLLIQQTEVVMKLELEAQAILRRETKDAVQIYLSKDPTFKNRISQQDNEINKVLEKLNKLVGSDTPTGKLLDIYCKLKSIPLQRQFDDVGYAYSPIEDWADVICGECNRLYTSIDNVIKTFEEIQTKASPIVIADLEKWQEKPAETEQDTKSELGEMHKWYQTNTFKFVVIPLLIALFLGIPAWLSLVDKADPPIITPGPNSPVPVNYEIEFPSLEVINPRNHSKGEVVWLELFPGVLQENETAPKPEHEHKCPFKKGEKIYNKKIPSYEFGDDFKETFITIRLSIEDGDERNPIALYPIPLKESEGDHLFEGRDRFLKYKKMEYLLQYRISQK